MLKFLKNYDIDKPRPFSRGLTPNIRQNDKL